MPKEIEGVINAVGDALAKIADGFRPLFVLRTTLVDGLPDMMSDRLQILNRQRRPSTNLPTAFRRPVRLGGWSSPCRSIIMAL